MLNFLKKCASVGVFLALLLGFLPQITQAATLSALRVSTTGGGTITMAPDEVKNITVTFQNTGDTTWKNDGPGYVSLYTYGPKYRTSVFDPGTWLSPSQVKRLTEPSVAPKGTGTISFQMRAPKTEGSYTETFNLASEDVAWITGSQFSLNIAVHTATTATTTSPSPSTTSTSSYGRVDDPSLSSTTSGYTAQLVTQTADSVQMKAGKTISFMALFKNTGTTTWHTYGLKAPDLSLASTGSADFSHSSWNGSQLALVTDQVVKPGDSAVVQFFFTAPRTNGTHTAKFQLTADDVSVPDAFVEIPVTVTGGAADALNTPIEHEDTTQYIDEPTIRVGILIVDDETNNEVYITSNESDFELRNTNGDLLGSFNKGQKVHAAYRNGRYVYGNDDQRSTTPLRFIPKTPNAVMTITNFDARQTRNASAANNVYRNVLELRYNDTKDRTWLINELPMEYYLRGLAETSNSSPMEFQKALITAARTYAFYHWQHATKHKAEGYTVDAYLDQVYRGYSQEAVTPRITEAVEETRGRIVTYNGATAITAYFSQSDGRTRSWNEVWGGDVPWSKSVAVPCEVGKKLLGHGVGMSARGAVCFANDGMKWDEILKYFYTGIDIDKKWE